MSNAIAFGMVKAQAAIGLVETGFSKLQQSIQQSAKIELDNLSSAAGLETMLGSFDAAAGFIDGMNAKLAKAAAALPGETAQYAALARTISDDVGGAFADANGKIKDVAGFEKTLTSISSSYSAMAATTGVSAGNMQLLMMRMVGGNASMREMSQIDALQNNPTLKRNLEAALKQAGVAELKDLDLKSRIKLIDEIGKKVITPEFIKRSESTLEGLTQSFKSNLFDPSTGIFGLMRDLDEKTKGNQTAYESIKRLTATVIGSGGLFDTIGKILQQLGLTADPMAVLRDGVETVNGWLTNINNALKGFKATPANLLETVKGLPKWLSEQASKLFNDAIGQAGAFLSSLSPKESQRIGEEAGAFIGRVAGAIARFFINLDYGEVLITVAQVGALLVSAIGGAIGGFGAELVNQWGQIGRDAIANIINWFRSSSALVMGAIGDSVNSMVKAVGDKVREFILSIPQKIAFSPISPIAPVANAVQAVAAPVTNAVSAVAAPVTNTVKSLTGFDLGSIGSLFPKYAGNIPNAADGLFSSLSAEMARMPAGATPVIANSSEAILTPSQLRNLVNGSASAGAARSGGGNTINISPTFTINGASDPETTARQVMRYMEILLEEHMQGAIA
jgi:hypothetical protein